MTNHDIISRTIVGHELFHGFDFESTTTGRLDTVNRWLKPTTLEIFKKCTNCLIKQYSGYCSGKDNVCLSGKFTLDENIADIDGMKVSYMAFKFLTQWMGGEPKMPGLEQFTQDQLFFISASKEMCGKVDDEMVYVKIDPHSPARARVKLPMMNIPAFAQAFNCPVGSRFAPMHTCSLWGDFLEPKMAD